MHVLLRSLNVPSQFHTQRIIRIENVSSPCFVPDLAGLPLWSALG